MRQTWPQQRKALKKKKKKHFLLPVKESSKALKAKELTEVQTAY